MNVVDSSGWIEYFVGGPNSPFFEGPLQDVENLLVPSISILEVYRYILRERGRQEALAAAASMRQGQVLDLDEGLAIEAAEIGASHGLPLADCIIYAAAQAHDATLWTQDADFEGLAGVEYRPTRRAL
ncbi:MAG: PIN domain-containing protein [Longimicrobiales bacterium]